MARRTGTFLAVVCAGVFITIEPSQTAGHCGLTGSFVDASSDIVAAFQQRPTMGERSKPG